MGVYVGGDFAIEKSIYVYNWLSVIFMHVCVGCVRGVVLDIVVLGITLVYMVYHGS